MAIAMTRLLGYRLIVVFFCPLVAKKLINAALSLLIC